MQLYFHASSNKSSILQVKIIQQRKYIDGLMQERRNSIDKC